MNFETVIGLEVHVELNTNSKIFSPTSAHFGNEQNANTNVIDWSFPGVLPVLNKGVVDAGIKAALALNMDIHQHMHFDRKNYFYPDNPKAYQISQFDEPIGYNGWIEVQLEDGSTKKIGIERAHLEEDAGKNTPRNRRFLLCRPQPSRGSIDRDCIRSRYAFSRRSLRLFDSP